MPRGKLYPVAVWPYTVRDTGTIGEAAPAAMERQRRMRRSYAVHFYSGRNGTGKSAWMIYDTLPDLALGRTVLSTVRLLDFENPRPCEGFVRSSVKDKAETGPCPVCALPRPKPHLQAHPLYVPFTDWPQLLDLGKAGWEAGDDEDAVCLMDEITGVADSSDSAALPNMVANELAQLRRAGVLLRLSGLNFIRASKRIREACLGVTRCESFLPVDAGHEAELMWRPRRLAVARTYDAKDLPLDDIKEAHWEEAEVRVKARAWIPSWEAIRAYDTLAPVDRVGMVDDVGRCAHCAGARKVDECICHDYQMRKAARAAERPARRAAPRTRAADLAGSPLAVAQ